MSILSTLQWIESTDLSTTIREGALPYPILGGFHLLGIALFGGMVLVTNLRLLGWGIERWRVSELVQQLRPWKWTGLVAVTITGLLLAGPSLSSCIEAPPSGSRWCCFSCWACTPSYFAGTYMATPLRSTSC